MILKKVLAKEYHKLSSSPWYNDAFSKIFFCFFISHKLIFFCGSDKLIDIFSQNHMMLLSVVILSKKNEAKVDKNEFHVDGS